MTEEFLRELGLDDHMVQAILERMQSHDAEQAALYDGMLRREKESRLKDLMERAGVRGGMAYRAVMEELNGVMERGGDLLAHIASMREQEPSFFAPIAPYFASAMNEDGCISGEKAPFHWIRPRERGNR